MWQTIAEQVGSVLGIAAAAAFLALSQRIWLWINAKLSEQHQHMLSLAADKVLTLGFTKLIPMIEREGWDSQKVRDAVIAFGMDEIKLKFPDAVSYIEKFSKNARVPLSSAGARVADSDSVLRDVLLRAMPEAATRAAASPITPPAAQPIDEKSATAVAAAAVAATLAATGP